MKKTIKLFFTDFWPNFNIEDNFFLKILKQKYNLELSENNPEYLFYSAFGYKHYKYNCTKIFYTGENLTPNFKECDFSLSFSYDGFNGRNFRLPLYPLFADPAKLTEPKDFEKILAEKTKFCNFIISNPNCPKRNSFFKKLSKYKKVDSAGKLYNNTGFRPINKLDFIKDYKFTIAFENVESPGYTSEKIFEPMLVNSLPVYWGNNLIYKDFNTKSFLNYYDFNNEDDLIERILQIDKDDNLFVEYLKQPFYTNNIISEYADSEEILKKLEIIINSEIINDSSGKRVLFDNINQSKFNNLYYFMRYHSHNILRKFLNFHYFKLYFKFIKHPLK